MLEQSKKDVETGLSSEPKFLYSKYFYDEIGDELFIQIMNMPEYYLTNAELEIFKEKTRDLIDALGMNKNAHFQLIELGAGDGIKTKELLKVLMNEKFNFDYLPIDISPYALDNLQKSLKTEIPELSVKTQQGDYFGVLSSLKNSNQRKIVLFLGSNIGNLRDEFSSKFLYELGANLAPGDKLMLGVDLIKSADIVLPAYNDKQGITAKFNLNLLTRMNKELGANFNIENFKHDPEYTEEEGVAKSFLTSCMDQDVYFSSFNKTVHFTKDERIHTEISRKYNDKIIQKIIEKTDFSLENKITDSKNLFADYILKRN